MIFCYSHFPSVIAKGTFIGLGCKRSEAISKHAKQFWKQANNSAVAITKPSGLSYCNNSNSIMIMFCCSFFLIKKNQKIKALRKKAENLYYGLKWNKLKLLNRTISKCIVMNSVVKCNVSNYISFLHALHINFLHAFFLKAGCGE